MLHPETLCELCSVYLQFTLFFLCFEAGSLSLSYLVVCNSDNRNTHTSPALRLHQSPT